MVISDKSDRGKSSQETPTIVIENNNVNSLAFQVNLDLRSNIPVIEIKVFDRTQIKKMENTFLVTPKQRLYVDENG